MKKLKSNIGEYGVIVNKLGEFLILKLPSSKTFKKELWMFPGGRVEINEQAEETLRREIIEETSLKVKIITPIHTAIWGYDNPDKYSVFYLCKIVGSDKVKISREHIEYAWIDFKDIEKISWHNINSKIAAKKGKYFLEHFK